VLATFSGGSMFKFSSRSERNLQGVHPDLVRVLRRAIKDFDFTVIEGVRTPERQRELYAQGRTKPGKIVTWTLTSRHFINPKTGFGHAVDIVPHPLDWNDIRAFEEMARVVKEAARQEGVAIRWGGDWNGDGVRQRSETDLVHFELLG